MSNGHSTYVRDFLACIAPNETQFVFQAIRDPEPRTAHAPLVGTLEQHIHALQSDNAQQHGIYWQVNPGAGRGYADITGVRAVFLDFDSGGLPALPLTPHCVVQTSPGKFQAYWRVSDCSLDEFDFLLNDLVAHWHSDPGAKGRNRIFRLPGFVHAKGAPFVCAITEWQPAMPAYTVGEIRAGLLAGYVAPARPSGEVTDNEWHTKDAEEQARTVEELRSALATISADDRDVWIAVGQGLHSLGDIGQELWETWAASSSKFPGGDGLERWDTFSGQRSDYRAVFARATAGGWVNPRSMSAKIAAMGPLFGAGAADGAVLQAAPPPAPAEPVMGSSLSFPAAASGAIPATPMTIAEALFAPGNKAFLGFDEFLGQSMINIGGKWRPIDDDDRMLLRIEFEKRGFKAVPGKLMAESMDHAALKNRFDSAMDWANGLVWDGVPRVSTALPRYYSTADTPYTRACGEYLFTALAGRCMSPGCQADMVLVFVGLQGDRKTSAARSLAPTPEQFIGMDFTQKDDNLARKFRGKLVIELGELKGLAGRDQESTKEWVTRREETWRPPYKEFQITYRRRSIFIGTGNKKPILDDETGERRWLPNLAGKVDIEALERDRDQLWAEGIAMWKAGGIRWQEAERLAVAEHAEFKVRDDWAPGIQQWLAEPFTNADGFDVDLSLSSRGDAPFTTLQLLRGALGYEPGKVDRRASDRVAKILTPLNYKNQTVKIKGHAVWGWRKVA